MATSEPLLLSAQGVPFRTLSLHDAGFDHFEVIITTRERLRERPEEVRAVATLFLKAWESYLTGDGEPANTYIHQANPQLSPEHIAQRHRLLVDFYAQDGLDIATIGAISTQRVEQQIAMLESLGRIEPGSVTPEAVIAPGAPLINLN